MTGSVAPGVSSWVGPSERQEEQQDSAEGRSEVSKGPYTGKSINAVKRQLRKEKKRTVAVTFETSNGTGWSKIKKTVGKVEHTYSSRKSII